MKELIQIQSRLKAPKKNKNTFGGYNYRSCEDILEAAKPICHELNCLINICDEIVEVGGRIYVKATATIYNADGQHFSATAYAREEETKKGMDAAQITGSASSYARKYALNGLLAIDDTKDADTNEYQQRTKQEQPTKARKTIGAVELDDEKTCNALLAWAYAAKNANYDKPFVASEYLAQHYDVSEHNRKRFDALFSSYLLAISNKK
jgi:hypothetical protein